MELHLGITRGNQAVPSLFLLALYGSSLFITGQAAFGDRLRSISVPERAYLPPTFDNIDSSQTLSSNINEQHQREATVATTAIFGPDRDSFSIVGPEKLVTEVVDTFGTDVPSGIGTDGIEISQAGEIGNFDAAQDSEAILGGTEVGQTSGLSLDGTDEGTVEEFSEQRQFDDGIPGRAGIDYPTLAAVPNTGFSCRNYDLPGYYVDQDALCQVFYICQRGGRQDSFLCPNGTLFNQQFLVCDWWYNVDCAIASIYFEINSRIYAGPGSRAVVFPGDEARGSSRRQQLSSTPAGLSEGRLPQEEAVRRESEADIEPILPDSITNDYSDYDAVRGNFDEDFVTTEGTVFDYGEENLDYIVGNQDYIEGDVDYVGRVNDYSGGDLDYVGDDDRDVDYDGGNVNYVGGSVDYVRENVDYDGVTDVQSQSTPLSIALSDDISLRSQDSFYRYIPPGEATLTSDGNSPTSISASLSDEGSVPIEEVTAYNYYPTEDATGTSTTELFSSDGDDFFDTPNTFDEGNKDVIFGQGGKSGFTSPQPLIFLDFEGVAPEGGTATTPIEEGGYDYTPPKNSSDLLPSTSENRPDGYSYPEPDNPLLLPEVPIPPPTDSYLPPFPAS